MIRRFHDSLFAGHLGVSRRVFRLQSSVYSSSASQKVCCWCSASTRKCRSSSSSSSSSSIQNICCNMMLRRSTELFFSFGASVAYVTFLSILSVPGLFYMDADFGLFAWLSPALWS